ncbi:TetR/AcrR family transcriptional regulator [Nocardioides psychrotolerans]|uniref:TetR/AcrR family transcriptional regulator n=1 Tax=Nocardioides psychrotolerans TaxID=1005945 RepID=UPI003137E89F
MTNAPPAAERLPHGPHGLSREEVRASQRHRMLEATLVAVGSRGYAATTVAHVTAQARVSRSAFYEQFADKRDAFLAAYDQWGHRFFDDLLRIGSRPAPLREVVAACGELIIDRGLREPEAARAFILEVYATGEVGLQRREEMLTLGQSLFHGLAAELRRQHPDLPPLNPSLGLAVIGASFELCAQALRHPDDDSLDRVRQAVEDLWLLGLTGVPSPLA